MPAIPISESAEWAGPGSRAFVWRDFRLGRFLFSLFVPPKGQKVVPTRAGIGLTLIALAIGVAAYNTSSNILFIVLSLLLSTIIVSGVLSWVNFGRTAWRITLNPPFRAGQHAVVTLDVMNRKKMLPSYGLAFNFRVSSGDHGRLVLRQRLDPGESRRMEWAFQPRRRGRELIEMSGVASTYPFGFLDKYFGGHIAREVYVWPARVGYRADFIAASAPDSAGEMMNRAGAGNDFVNLRQYRQGDSHRHIHWKASARQRKLMVRQLFAENFSGFFVHVETPMIIWHNPEQFEQLCSVAATLTEDLFRQGQLVGAMINDSAPFLIRRVADLELFFDQLSVLEPVDQYTGGRSMPAHNVISFEPGNNDGVHAYVRGKKAATA